MPERSISTRVLLVEDNVGLLDTLADILQVAGMEVDKAIDAPTALRMLEAGRYDVAVVDMVLPGLSGVDVIRKLKDSSPATRIVVCTAYYDSELLTQAQALGIDQTLHKPADPAVLVDLIRKLAALKNNQQS
jgi:DNA-binding response OmpR family regulator